MITKTTIAAGVGAVALAAGGVLAGTQLADSNTTTAAVVTTQATTPPRCGDWVEVLSTRECFAAGAIRYVALHNLQGALQFCKWKAANPGEWSRLKSYSETSVKPSAIVTWFGASIQNQLEAYFSAGAPPFIIQPNTAQNICKTPLPPPTGLGVTNVDETSLTLTWEAPK